MNLDSRLARWAASRPERVHGHNPWHVAVEMGRATGRHRLIGLAAEMSFFSLVALVPLTVAFGAAVAMTASVTGTVDVEEAQAVVLDVLSLVVGADLAVRVSPFVRGLLSGEQGGLALTSVLAALWLGGRVYTPVIFLLDVAYGVEDPRSPTKHRLLALGLAVASFAAVTVLVGVLVVGPLLGGGRFVARSLELERVFEIVWSVARWPTLVAVLTAFLLTLYRYGPGGRRSWKSCLPGAGLAVALWVLVAGLFRFYLGVSGRGVTSSVSGADDSVVLVAQAVGAVVATELWVFLLSLSVLLGGEFNAVLARGGATGRLAPSD